MSCLTENTFSSYQLTEEEELQGSLLTVTQKQVIQNDIAVYAEQKLALEFDTNDQLKFVQQESKLSGQIEALRYRLQCSEVSEDALAAIDNPPNPANLT